VIKKKRVGASFVLGILAVTVGVAFAGTVTYAVLRFGAGYAEAKTAVSNGVPSTETLVDARTVLRRLNTAMDAALLARMQGRVVDRDGVSALRAALEDDLSAYRALPGYPEELDERQKLDAAIAHLDRAQSSMIGLLDSGALADADAFENADWRLATDDVDATLHGLLLIDMGHVHEHADQLASIAGRSIIVVAAGGLLSLIAAALAISIAMRAVRAREADLAERAIEWELFSARMAHDILSPLQVVSLAIEAASGHTDREVVRLSQRGQRALRKLGATVRALLDFARSGGKPTPGQRARADDVVASLVDELGPVAAENRVELHASTVDAIDVGCSAATLDILLGNLLRNAIHCMDGRPVRTVRVAVSGAPRMARFEVWDTGPGVPPGMQARVFDPFVRGADRANDGVGLGLATVKRLTEAHGGRVGVRSEPGEGSVFWIELPRA
jgi:signal transduction histidine kinase